MVSPGSKITLKSASYLYSTLTLKKGEVAVSKQLRNFSFCIITRERITCIFKSYNTFRVILLSPFYTCESRHSKLRSQIFGSGFLSSALIQFVRVQLSGSTVFILTDNSHPDHSC